MIGWLTKSLEKSHHPARTLGTGQAFEHAASASWRRALNFASLCRAGVCAGEVLVRIDAPAFADGFEVRIQSPVVGFRFAGVRTVRALERHAALVVANLGEELTALKLSAAELAKHVIPFLRLAN